MYFFRKGRTNHFILLCHQYSEEENVIFLFFVVQIPALKRSSFFAALGFHTLCVCVCNIFFVLFSTVHMKQMKQRIKTNFFEPFVFPSFFFSFFLLLFGVLYIALHESSDRYFSLFKAYTITQSTSIDDKMHICFQTAFYSNKGN